jgi:FecR protein
MRHFLNTVLIAATLSAWCAPVLAADGQGTAVGVNPDAVAEAGSQKYVLVVGANVQVGERVVTGPSGQVQILFQDQTKLVVGPNSALVIEQYLLRGDTDASKFTVSALSGTFRFITGKSAKDAYEIKTPTGTIGVRGTAFDLTVIKNVASYLMLFNGKVKACTLKGECVDVTAKCEIGTFDTTQAIVIGTEEDRQKLLELFPYAHFQSILDGRFRISGANKCAVEENIAVDKGGYDAHSVPERTITPDPGPDPGADPDPTDPTITPDPNPIVVPPVVIPIITPPTRDP